ncbi:MAG: hypothetical protein IJX89_01660 [Alphaproteobacteria bacterium]|nr:hypothetical protein [Alphaproteobacteria bacterium]
MKIKLLAGLTYLFITPVWAGGDVSDTLCQYLDTSDVLAVETWGPSCLEGSTNCDEFADYVNNGSRAEYNSGTVTLTECDGLVCHQEQYSLVINTDSMTGADCQIVYEDLGEVCEAGASWTDTSRTECCYDWQTTTRSVSGSVSYKYRTCGTSGGAIYHQYKCNEDRNYYAGDGTYDEYGFLLSKAPDSGYVTCTWDDSTNAPTKNSCTGCVACTTGTTYESTDDACYDRKITWSYYLRTDDVYGDYGLCTNDRAYLNADGSYYVCAAGCYGIPTSSTTGCTQCPKISALGTTNYETNITSDALKLYQLATATGHGTTLGNSYRGATSITGCYANSGANVDLGAEYITHYQDSTGIFYWQVDEMSYNCYWE